MEERKKRVAISTALQGMNELKLQKLNNLKVKQTENDSLKRQIDQNTKHEHERLKTERARKITNQANLKMYLLDQQRQKQEASSQAKMTDIKMAEIGIKKEEIDAQKRNDYFERLNKFQQDADRNFQVMRGANSSFGPGIAKGNGTDDEAAYLRSIQNQELSQLQSDQKQALRLEAQRLTTRRALKQQMEENKHKLVSQKEQDQHYAQVMKNQDQNTFQQEMSDRDRQVQKQKEYLSQLTLQMKDQKDRKKYDGMMTDQERQLNNRDMEAYQNREPTLYSNKIGFHYSPGTKMSGFTTQGGQNLTADQAMITSAMREEQIMEDKGLRPTKPNFSYGVGLGAQF